jgi:hypothetical protein
VILPVIFVASTVNAASTSTTTSRPSSSTKDQSALCAIVQYTNTVLAETVICDNALLAQSMTTLRRRSAAALRLEIPNAVGARAQSHTIHYIHLRRHQHRPSLIKDGLWGETLTVISSRTSTGMSIQSRSP